MEKSFRSASCCAKFGNVPNGILVGHGPSFQCTIVATGSPSVFFLGDEVEGRRPGAIGTPRGTVSEHLLKLAIRMWSGASRSGLEVTGGLGVVRM